ncbi:MAG: ATP-binding protein, partial [Candidatus Binatia bacterium]
ILIDNAIKFTAQGSVAISAKFVPASGAVEFTVADTGIGIPTEFHNSIFEIFHQVDNSGTREYGGLGLGLFIAKQLAGRLGAQLRVQSEVGQGSTFTLTVPLDNNLHDTRFTPEAVQQAGISSPATNRAAWQS